MPDRRRRPTQIPPKDEELHAPTQGELVRDLKKLPKPKPAAPRRPKK